MLHFIEKIATASIRTATALPVAVVVDVVTLGGALTDKEGTYTGTQLEKIGHDIDEALK